jgi:amino acid transporter
MSEVKLTKSGLVSTPETQILEVEPLRNLGFWAIWALGVGAVVGDGIFLLLGQGIATAGPSAFLAFLVAGIFQLFLMVALGELAVGMPNAGAMSVWVERFMGKWWGFLAGFAFAFGWVIAGGSTGIAIGRITCWFFPSLDVDTWTVIFAIVFLTIFAILNILGTSIAAKTQLVLVIGLVLVVVLFSIAGFKDVNMDYYRPFLPNGWEGFWLAIPLGTYAYLGAATLTTAGGECKNPRDLPKALVWASITFLIIYTAAQFVVEGIIPWQEVSMDVSPFTAAAEKSIGFIGGFVINLAAWIAAATCLIMGTIYAPSRIFYSHAKSGYLPKWFGYLHPQTRTPIYGIIAIWAVGVVLILVGMKNPDFLYVTLTLQLVLAWMISWTLALIAAWLYRKRFPEEVDSLGWKQPLFPLFPIVGFIGIIIVTYYTFASIPWAFGTGAIWIGALALYYFFVSKKRIEKIEERKIVQA